MQHYSTQEIHTFAILLAFALYFVLKVLFFLYKWKHRTLLSRNRTLKKLKRLSWDDFERLCMELFQKRGWKVLGNEKKGADGGVDIWMEKQVFLKRTSAIVQCKRYDDALVTVKVLREMYGLMYEHDIDEAYIVTTSRFTKECYKFIEEKPMVLIDGERLVKMIN